MHQQPTDPATEVKRLQRCMNHLVSVLALPAVWSVSEPSRILDTFLDALLVMLDLDFLYARVRIDSREAPVDALRTAPLFGTSHSQEELRHALNQWTGKDPQQWPEKVIRPVGGQEISAFPIRMGIEEELGLIVAGSKRRDFPEQTESLVLNVAANQLAIGLQQALRLNEQKRVASELDRRVAERTMELAETNKELQLQVGLLQHLPVSTWTLKPDGTPDFVNQIWLDFSAQTLDFVRSHPEAWMAAVHPEDRETASTAFWEGVRSGQGFAFETRSLRAQDGVYRWHLNQAVPLRDADGKVLKFVGTTTDIDDQKRSEEALAELDRAKTAFFSNVSHEFRTPLTLMLGPLEEVLAHERLESEGHELLATVRRNDLRLLKLVNALLDFSRMEAGRAQTSYQPTDLASFTSEIASAFDSAMKNAGLRFSVECLPIADPVYVDRDMWEKIVLNLLSNEPLAKFSEARDLCGGDSQL